MGAIPDWGGRLIRLRAGSRASAGRLGDLSPDQRAEAARTLRASSAAAGEWARVFTWLEARPGECPAYTPGVPILLYRQRRSGHAGLVGFATAEDPGLEQDLAKPQLREGFRQGACLAAAELPAQPDRPLPAFHFDLCERADGGSAGLSGFLATLFHALDLPLPRRWAATGAAGPEALAPLACAPAALAAKAEAARDFGFDTLLLVDGETPPPLPAGLRVVHVRAKPKEAIQDILALLFAETAYAGRSLAGLCVFLDRAWRGDPAQVVDSPLVAVARAQDGENGFFANLAHGHALLHLGRSAEARAPMAKARRLKPGIRLLDHPYQGYILWESVAKDGILWLDNGHLSPADPRHLPLVEADERLDLLHRHQPTSATAHARLAVGNTLALLHEFQGRLDGDLESLRRSWALRWRARDEWEQAFRFELRQNPRGSLAASWRRQRNLLVDAVHSMLSCGETPGRCRTLLGHVREACAPHLGDGPPDPYDLVAEAKMAVIAGDVTDAARAARLLAMWLGLPGHKRAGYPAIKVPELLAWHAPEGQAPAAVREALTASGLRQEAGSSILSLLRLRSDAALARLEPGKSWRAPAYASRNRRFLAIAKRLGSTPGHIFVRCPY